MSESTDCAIIATSVYLAKEIGEGDIDEAEERLGDDLHIFC